MLEMGFARGIWTVMTLICFLGICWWAYRPASRARFEEDGWMAFEETEKTDLQHEAKAAQGGDA